MNLPQQLGDVDPIVASFTGGAVGVLSMLLLVEVNNAKEFAKARCVYCAGTGYLPCAQCGSKGKLVERGMGGARCACGQCSGTGKVMCTSCLCTGRSMATEQCVAQWVEWLSRLWLTRTLPAATPALTHLCNSPPIGEAVSRTVKQAPHNAASALPRTATARSTSAAVTISGGTRRSTSPFPAVMTSSPAARQASTTGPAWRSS